MPYAMTSVLPGAMAARSHPVWPAAVLTRAPAAAPAPQLHGVSSAEVRHALAELLASEVFRKARRMSRLISFLVDQQLAGSRADTGEYAIGIEVFDRDPATYSTGDDPIVRVQVGRLRERLRAYYATSGAGAALRLSIPIGSYMPVITRPERSAARFSNAHLLGVLPLQNFIQDQLAPSFTQGMDEELCYQLFKAFGHKIVAHTFAAQPGSVQRSPGLSHLLEGSVRADGESMRISVRLVDAGAGCIAWSEQFDRRAPLSIALQEELALAICAALARYFEQG